VEPVSRQGWGPWVYADLFTQVKVDANYLAFDLGAESGRALLGQLRSGALEVHEVRRFRNHPIRESTSRRWDVRRSWQEMQQALDDSLPKLTSIGVDSWGVDYALLDENGTLLENPYHYRDSRTDGVMDAVFAKVSRDRIYSATGVQFLPFNTLYQLYAACLSMPQLIDDATALLTIPDLMNYWLTGEFCSEYTNATTTQLVDPEARAWATGLMKEIGLPVRLFQPLVEPGTEIGAYRGTPVIAPACHDTGSAVAAISMSPDSAFLSSGTWSLLGAELTTPVISAKARDLNFTNEGGVCGTVRLLKNIAGLWLMQSCRQHWTEYSYEDLTVAARDNRYAFRSLLDPDDSAFLHPENMPLAIADYCAKTGQPAPADPGSYTRAILESLAFKYRSVLESLEEITGIQFKEIRIVGGGARNRLLNQFTANATGRVVIAGPVEATALGNIAMQMLATGAAGSLAEAREVIGRSLPTDRYIPSDEDLWDSHYARFRELPHT
jgi:rhamnulokinase